MLSIIIAGFRNLENKMIFQKATLSNLIIFTLPKNRLLGDFHLIKKTERLKITLPV